MKRGADASGVASEVGTKEGEATYVLPVVLPRNVISQAIYTYEMWTGLYMLDAWEKLIFSACPLHSWWRE